MSVANDLASGSQDLAALLGLFCTDGVERNALAYNFGWGTVVASSLSLLGVLGLVKSSIKVALGLKYCQQAGFNLDSIRGIFGYLPGESPATGSLLECGVVVVKLSSSGMSITKTRRYVYSRLLKLSGMIQRETGKAAIPHLFAKIRQHQDSIGATCVP